MLNQKLEDESELAQVAREARSVLARLDTLLKREEKTTNTSGTLPRKRDRDGDDDDVVSLAQRNARELSSIFGEDTMDGMTERLDSVESFAPPTDDPAAMDADLEDALNEARGVNSSGSRYVSPLPAVTIHPVFPNTFKVRNAQQAREQVKAEKAIATATAATATAASPRPVKRKTPLNPALIAAPKKSTSSSSYQARGWAGRGNTGQGNKFSKRPYDAEHAERMRRRSTSAAPSKRRVRRGNSSGGGGGGGMSMVDPEERYAEQRDDARSNRDGGSDRGSSGSGGGGYTRGWKGL